jgi:hypothetical protein
MQNRAVAAPANAMAHRHQHVDAFKRSQQLMDQGGIVAGFASDFADALGCAPFEIVTALSAAEVDPLTETINEDPDRYHLSFCESGFQTFVQVLERRGAIAPASTVEEAAQPA